MSCNHRSKKCVCFDLSDSKWQVALEDAAFEGGYTLQQIGDLFGFSRMAICKAEHVALDKVRNILANRRITADDV